MKLRITIGDQTVLVPADKAEIFLHEINESVVANGGKSERYGRVEEFKPLSLELRIAHAD